MRICKLRGNSSKVVGVCMIHNFGDDLTALPGIKEPWDSLWGVYISVTDLRNLTFSAINIEN